MIKFVLKNQLYSLAQKLLWNMLKADKARHTYCLHARGARGRTVRRDALLLTWLCLHIVRLEKGVGASITPHFVTGYKFTFIPVFMRYKPCNEISLQMPLQINFVTNNIQCITMIYIILYYIALYDHTIPHLYCVISSISLYYTTEK